MRLRAWATAAILVLFGAFTGVACAEPGPRSTARFVTDRPDLAATPVSVGRFVEGNLVGAEVDRYSFPLAAGQFAAIEIRQSGGDVAAALFDPEGRLVDLADRTPAGGVEQLTVAAAKSGAYSVQVAMFAWDSPPATYSIGVKFRERVGKRPAERADQLLRAWYDPASPGAAVAVVRSGKIVFQRTIGLANVETGAPITSKTRFDLASVSKQFTAFGIAILASRGDVRLDDDIRKYIPEMPDYGKKITLGRLLDHTAGLRDWDAAFGLMGYGPDAPLTADRIVATTARQRALNFPPGSAEAYSNTGYVLLSEVIARVEKKPFATWMDENVFSPAGMTAIANDRSGSVIPGRANSYRGRYPVNLVSGAASAMAGSSSVQASLEDLVAWNENFRTGRAGGAKVLEMIEERGVLNDGTRTSYAFGQWIGDRAGLRKVGHLGLFAGFRISYRRFPDRDLAVIYMTNDGDDASYLRAETVENLFLGLDAEPVTAPDDDYTPPSKAIVIERAARDYAGVYYSDELNTAYVVSPGADGLYVAHAANGRCRLNPAGDDRFGTEWPFMTLVEFDRRNGAVTGFRVSTESARDMAFRKVAD